jgi:hypothetical protein
MHTDVHPLAGQTVTLTTGDEYRLEDWWDHLTGKSWQDSQQIAAWNYASMAVTNNLPLDDEVVYGKIGALGYLVHVSQIAN